MFDEEVYPPPPSPKWADTHLDGPFCFEWEFTNFYRHILKLNHNSRSGHIADRVLNFEMESVTTKLKCCRVWYFDPPKKKSFACDARENYDDLGKHRLDLRISFCFQ